MQHPEDQAATDPQRLAALRMARSRDFTFYVGWVFAAIGVLLLVIGAISAVHTAQFRAGAQTTDGVVVERTPHHSYDRNDKFHRDSVTYSITAEYTVNGHTYRCDSSGSSNPAPELGEHVPVYFRPENPRDAQVGGSDGWMTPLILTPLGLVFFGIGVGVLVWIRRTRRRHERLARIGRALPCAVESVVANTTYDKDGNTSTAWVLTARYDDPLNGEELRFRRDYSKNPRTATGAVVTVFVDPDKPSSYLVVAD